MGKQKLFHNRKFAISRHSHKFISLSLAWGHSSTERRNTADLVDSLKCSLGKGTGNGLEACLFEFLTSLSTTKLYRERVPRLTSDNFACRHTRHRVGRP